MYFNLKYFILPALILPLLVLSSCSEDELDKWEIIQAESVCSIADGTTIPYMATEFFVDIKSNSNWSVSLPRWMSADRTQGSGDARLPIKISANEESGQRTGTVQVTYGNAKEPFGNVVGGAAFSTKIIQQAKHQAINIKVISASIDRTGYEPYYNRGYKYYKRYGYLATVTYEVESEFSDEEIAELIRDFRMCFRMRGRTHDPYMSNVWEGEMVDVDVDMDLLGYDPLPVTRGMHTVEISEFSYYEWKGVFSSAKVCPRYGAKQGDKWVDLYDLNSCDASFQYLN